MATTSDASCQSSRISLGGGSGVFVVPVPASAAPKLQPVVGGVGWFVVAVGGEASIPSGVCSVGVGDEGSAEVACSALLSARPMGIWSPKDNSEKEGKCGCVGGGSSGVGAGARAGAGTGAGTCTDACGSQREAKAPSIAPDGFTCCLACGGKR